jgi:ABC-type lipoprotein export system ATPase subunit
MKTILRARGIEKSYKSGEVETQALRGVDLEIHAGEFTAMDSRYVRALAKRLGA